jgi:hypothetical protein
MPYNFKIGAMQGDWYDAAAYYRDWAVDRIVHRKPMYDPDTDFPSILLDVDGLTAYSLDNGNEGLSAKMLQGMHDSKEFYGIDKVACTLYLWTNEPGTTAAWPDVTPVYNIQPGVALMHSDGDLAIPYVQMAYDKTLTSYVQKNIEYYCMKKIDGTLIEINDLTRPDPSMQFWQDFSTDWNKNATDFLGFDGSYWDFWSGLNLPDYDPNHGHPLGGGNYHIEGKIEQAQLTRDTIRQQLSGYEEWFLTSEYLNEYFIDVNEIEMWNEDLWDTNIGEQPMIRVPLYEVVYGDRQMMWTATQSYLLYQPTWINFAAYKFAAKMSMGFVLGFNGTVLAPCEPAVTPHGIEAFHFLGKLMRSYDYAREYLLWGRKLRNVHVDNVSYMVYGDIMVLDPNKQPNFWMYTPSYPNISMVIPSVWGYVDDEGKQRIAIVLINWFEEDRIIKYSVKFDDYGLKKGRWYDLKILDKTGERYEASYRNDFTRTDLVPAYGLKILTFHPMLKPKLLGGIDKSK